jgi:hypothetical protein
MTYEIIKKRTGRTNQHHDGVVEKKEDDRGCCFGFNRAMWNVSPANVSIHSRGWKGEKKIACSREKGCIYNKTANKLNLSCEELRQSNGAIVKRYHQRFNREVFKEKTRWLNKFERLNVFTILIGCFRRRYCKSIAHWFLRGYGYQNWRANN